MSFIKLPEEVLDQICAEVAKFPKISIRTFLSLALVCRSTLSSARTALYRAPLNCVRVRRDRSKAIRLLETIVTRPHLSKRVKDLSRLHSVVVRLAVGRQDEDLDLFDWQKALVNITAVKHVSLNLPNQAYAKDLATSLTEHKMLKTVNLSFVGGQGAQKAFSAWAKAYKPSSPSLPIIRICVDHHNTSDDVVRPDYSPRTLRLILSRGCARAAVSFLPDSLSSLTRLVIDYNPDGQCLSLPTLLSNLDGNSLRVVFLNGPEGIDAIEHYFGPFEELKTPRSVFSLFPKLRSMRIQRFSALDFDKLSLLAESSPSLTKLQLQGGCWSLTPDSFQTLPSLSPDTQLVAILRKMSNLKHVHLGTFPVLDASKALEQVEKYCQEAGIELGWEGLSVEDLNELALVNR